MAAPGNQISGQGLTRFDFAKSAKFETPKHENSKIRKSEFLFHFFSSKKNPSYSVLFHSPTKV